MSLKSLEPLTFCRGNFKLKVMFCKEKGENPNVRFVNHSTVGSNLISDSLKLCLSEPEIILN